MSASPTWSHDALLHELLVVPRSAYVQPPDMVIIERPGWKQLLTPSFKQGGLNEVALAVLDGSEAEVDDVIDRTIAQYRELGIRFRWTVGPDSRPADLGERLERRGLLRRDLLGMYRGTEGHGIAVAEGVTVELVDEASAAEFTRVMAAGWSIDPAPLEAYQRLLLADPAGRHRLFLAREHGVAAGVASYVAFPRSAFLIGGVVLPEYRRRGLYHALVAARLDDAAARGLPIATVHAMAATSAPVLEKLQFEPVVHFAAFANG